MALIRRSNATSLEPRNDRKMGQGGIAFAAISILAALISILFLYLIGIEPNLKIGALTTVLFGFLLFTPIPVGLGFTYCMVSQCEDKVKDVYKWLFEAVAHIKAVPQEKTQVALDNLQNMLGQKSDGMWKRIFMHGSRNN